MSRKKAIFLYLLGTLGQIWLLSVIVFVLRLLGMVIYYTTPMGIVVIGIGGVSSALWGTIIAVRYKKYSAKKILKDFFAIKQNRGSYLFVIVFLFLDFCYVAFDGELAFNTWYIPIILFLKAILFGGIEEVGWRYVFQPIIMNAIVILVQLYLLLFHGEYGIFLISTLKAHCRRYSHLDFCLDC